MNQQRLSQQPCKQYQQIQDQVTSSINPIIPITMDKRQINHAMNIHYRLRHSYPCQTQRMLLTPPSLYSRHHHYSRGYQNISSFLERYYCMTINSKLQWSMQPKYNKQSWVLWRRKNHHLTQYDNHKMQLPINYILGRWKFSYKQRYQVYSYAYSLMIK